MKISALTVIVTLIASISNGFQGYQIARPGDISAGVAVDEKNQRDQHPPQPDNPQNPERVLLNVTPCEERPTIIEFRRPYRVLRVEQGGCSGGPYPGKYVRVQVEKID